MQLYVIVIVFWVSGTHLYNMFVCVCACARMCLSKSADPPHCCVSAALCAYKMFLWCIVFNRTCTNCWRTHADSARTRSNIVRAHFSLVDITNLHVPSFHALQFRFCYRSENILFTVFVDISIIYTFEWSGPMRRLLIL
jgi:hypothetical protein